MPFFARPDLSNEQFKQLPDSILSLSGQTRIGTTSGLTLADGAGNNIIVTAENANSHVGDVLTYDGVGKIKLLPSGSGGDPIYPATCKSPASVNLCGISQGFVLTGKTLSCILQTLLVPTLNPTLTPPYNTFSISPATSPVEVGTSVVITANATYNRGVVSPVYCSGPSVRTGLPSAYNYTYFGITPAPVISSSLSNSTTFPAQTIQLGSNTLSGRVSYLAGEYPKDSVGSDWIAGGCCSAGITTPAVQAVITGVYPWFWGKSSTLPVAGQTLINTGNKVTASSAAGITVPNFNATDEYIWFAIPSASPSRTFWQDITNTSNNGVIPGALFPTMTPVTVNSFPSGLWSSQSYKFYISGYKTSVNYGITLT